MSGNSESRRPGLREQLRGLIGVRPKVPVRDNYALSLIYTPGVAEPCKQIEREPGLSFTYTWRGNAVALVGETASSLPHLESVAVMLKVLAGIDAVPLVVQTEDEARQIQVLRSLAPTFGGLWLVGLKPAQAGRVIQAAADLDIVLLRPPRDAEHCLADPSIYPGLLRVALDLRLNGLDARLVIEATHQGDEQQLLFRTAPRVARAVAEKAIELGLQRTAVSAADIERRLRDYLETGRLEPFALPEDWALAETDQETALRLHALLAGAAEIEPKIVPRDPARLCEVTSGAEAAGNAIARSPERADTLTGRGNMVAVVTDGSAVLGLGDIGAAAGLPVMLGKSVLFKTFAGCDAVPICLDATEPLAIIEAVQALEPSFGGINLEDISAPRCFEIEDELKKQLDIFVFHDDQHGTAVVTLAALMNAARLSGKPLEDLTVTFNGAGAAGIAVTRLLLRAGVRDVVLCDRAGAIHTGRSENMNPIKEQMAALTNRAGVKGSLAQAIKGRDVFIGLSVGGALTGDMIRTMAPNPIVLAMANPDPEVMPPEATAAGAAAVATGRSDFPNQVNNCLGFPGIFRGALDVRAKAVNDEMKIAAAEAIAALVGEDRLRPDYFIPSAMDLRVPPAVAEAIARAAIETGEARIPADPAQIRRRTERFLYQGRLE